MMLTHVQRHLEFGPMEAIPLMATGAKEVLQGNNQQGVYSVGPLNWSLLWK